MKGHPIDWQPEELAWIGARKDWPRAELHLAFGAHWQRDVSRGALASLCKRKGWLTGRTGGFQKGMVPANKGKKMPLNPNSVATRFKPGGLPGNYRGPGHESVRSDGYVWLIVAETNPYTGAATRPVQKHRRLWEQANGPIPDGHVLKCLDGDRLNTDPANWEPVPRALIPRLAGRWRVPYDSAPAELKPVLLSIAKVEHAARELGRKTHD